MSSAPLARLKLLAIVCGLVAAIGFTALLARSDATAAGTFTPASTVALADDSAGATSDIVTTFKLPKGDYNFGGTVGFTPTEWALPKDADIPDGALISRLESKAVLGLLGEGCNNGLGVGFDLMDGTTNQAATVPFDDPEEDDPSDGKGSEPDDQFDLAGGLPLGVALYPDYLTRIFKSPEGQTLVPRARLYGQTLVANIEVSLNFMLFEPGIVIKLPNGLILGADPRQGFASVTVLQALGDPEIKPNTGDTNVISDFCSPLDVTTTTFGTTKDNPNTPANEGGVASRTNPPAGTYNFTVFALSQRDGDGDGIENGLDTCAQTATTGWDPRVKISDPAYAGDGDKDGLPDDPACDPKPTEASPTIGGVFDEDADFYGNRADNCPLNANSLDQPGGSGPDNQKDSDFDGVGDACDQDPKPNGEQLKVCLVSPVAVGGGGAAPSPAPQDMQPCDPNAVIGGTVVPGVTPTPTSGTPSAPGTVGPAPGVGALAPAISSIPTWATILSGLGGAGLLGSLGAFASRIFGVRWPGRRED